MRSWSEAEVGFWCDMYEEYGSLAHGEDNTLALNDSQPYLQSHIPPSCY